MVDSFQLSEFNWSRTSSIKFRNRESEVVRISIVNGAQHLDVFAKSKAILENLDSDRSIPKSNLHIHD